LIFLACFFFLLRRIWETCFAVGFLSRAGRLEEGVVDAGIGGGAGEGAEEGAEEDAEEGAGEVAERVGAINAGVRI
jgi:hypothetical protein